MYCISAPELHRDGYKMSCTFAAAGWLFVLNFWITSLSTIKIHNLKTLKQSLVKEKWMPPSGTRTNTLNLLSSLVSIQFQINSKSMNMQPRHNSIKSEPTYTI